MLFQIYVLLFHKIARLKKAERNNAFFIFPVKFVMNFFKIRTQTIL